MLNSIVAYARNLREKAPSLSPKVLSTSRACKETKVKQRHVRAQARRESDLSQFSRIFGGATRCDT